MKYVIPLIACLAVAGPVIADTENTPLMWDPDDVNQTIVVNNRLLAKVNDKPITVLDVMRKLDMIFYQRYPQYASSKQARAQFYDVAWRRVLDELIDKELLMLEAKELKLEVNNGEVRKEMERLFGPNVVANLDTIGMTYDEAWKLVYADMINQRMLYVKVNAKVLKQVTPKEVKAAFDTYLAENTPPPRWIYRVITIRDPDPKAGAQSAQQIREALESSLTYGEGITLEGLADPELFEELKGPNRLAYTDLKGISADTKVTVSETFEHTSKEISQAYSQALAGLKSGEYSAPISQVSRADRSTVFRIFYLQQYVQDPIPTFTEMEGKMRADLIGAALERETEVYLKSLRKKHAITNEQLNQRLPDDFEPFALR